MTRIAGTDLISTPCCGREYATPAYASLNFTALEYWTDGYAHRSLAPQDGGLRRCGCGRYFLLRHAQRMYFVPSGKGQPPARRPSARPDSVMATWSAAVKGWFGRPGVAGNKPDAPPTSRPFVPNPALWPQPAGVSDGDLPDVVAAATGNPELEIAARRRWWHGLNHPYREVYRTSRETAATGDPPYEPSRAQIENMRLLLALLQVDPAAHRTEIAELHRELGEPEAAEAVLGPVGVQSPPLMRAIGECLKHGRRGPIRYSV